MWTSKDQDQVLRLPTAWLMGQQVEGEAQGDEETVQKFLAQVDRGPRLAHVVKVEKRELEPTQGENHFAVMRTMDSMFNSGS